MKLLTFQREDSERIGILISEDGILDLVEAKKVLPFGIEIPASLAEFLALGEKGLERAKSYLAEVQSSLDKLSEAGAIIPMDQVKLLPPIPNPGLILSVGMNYWRHLKEMSGTPAPKNPAAFIKAQDTLLGSQNVVTIPPQCPDMIDYEGEFCVVMGKVCHNIAVAEAMDYVAGYTIANDISARDWVGEVFTAEGEFPAIQAWERNINGKQLPGFTPCGPVIVTKDEIPYPHNVYMETRLNGEVMQSTKTDDMVFNIPDVIAYYSQWYRFRPGDIITTGSPAGVGFGRDPKIFMKAGDLVEVEVEGIGTLSNTLR